MARENPDAVDESWLQDTIVPSSPPESAKAAASPAAPPRKAPPPPRRVDRDAELAERTEEVQRMLRGVTSQLNALQGEAAKSAAKLADSAAGAIAQAGGKLLQIFAAPFLILLKIVMFPLMLVQRLLGRLGPAAAAGDDEEDLPDWDHETTKDDPPPEELGSFSDMLELNIIFMDNQRTPLYSMAQTRGTGRLGRVEEQFIMDNSLQAIRECAEFTAELPTPTTGPYANEPIRTIMEGVQPVDVGRFLAFVKAFPGKYIGKSWKVSETFATWLLNNAPGSQG